MSSIVPWTEPEGAPCCCEINCEHTANFVSPVLWDPLTQFATSLNPVVQVELTADQYVLLTSGGTLTAEVAGSASNTSETELLVNGPIARVTISISGSSTFVANFAASSCKQKNLTFERFNSSFSCSRGSSVFNDTNNFYPFIQWRNSCLGGVGFSARFSFYNNEGSSPGKLYQYGMYVIVRAFIASNFVVGEFGEEGFDIKTANGYAMGELVTIQPENSTNPIILITSAGNISIPCLRREDDIGIQTSSGVSASLTFESSAP